MAFGVARPAAMSAAARRGATVVVIIGTAQAFVTTILIMPRTASIFVVSLERDAPTFPPNQHQSERDEADEQRKPASGRNFVNIGGDESEVEQKEKSRDWKD